MMKKGKRIAAIIGVIAILSLYVASMLLGIFASDKYPGLFLASTFLAVIVPIMIYCFVAVYRYVHKNDKPNDTLKEQDIEDINKEK